MAKVTVRIASNFERNLDAIRDFLAEQGASAPFTGLVESVVLRLVPMLESHPRVGRDWMLRTPLTAKGRALRARIKVKLGNARELREFVLDDYLVLYSIDGSVLTLLAVRHHRQLTFDVSSGRSDRT